MFQPTKLDHLSADQKLALWLGWVHAIEDEGRDVTEWELSFVDDMKEKLMDDFPLTPAQSGKLEQIYTERTP
jgi:hypothetical protein